MTQPLASTSTSLAAPLSQMWHAHIPCLPHPLCPSAQVACVALRLARYCRCLPLMKELRYGTSASVHSALSPTGAWEEVERWALEARLEGLVARWEGSRLAVGL